MATAPRRKVASSAPVEAGGQDLFRMRDLVRLTGLPRETIHFYLAQGLLPKPVKTGRNTAVYAREHLDRLERIRDLQERHFLPLKAIKHVLEESDGGGFSEEQQAMLRRLRASMPPARWEAPASDVALSTLVPSRISRADIDEMEKLGLVEVKGRGRDSTVSAEDANILACWADVGALFRPGESEIAAEELGIYDEAMETLVDKEARLLTGRYLQMSGDRAAELIETGEPFILKLLAALRRKKIAALLRAIPAAPARR